MEPNGIVDCMKQIWNSGKAWLKVFVSDDDSSSHAALKHTLEARMTLENLLEPPRGPDEKIEGYREVTCLDESSHYFFC